jgi:hypothetical protein
MNSIRILSVVSCVAGTWSVALLEEGRLKVCGKRVPSKIFGLKREEVSEESRKLHKEELYDLACSQYMIRLIKSMRTRWLGHVAHVREKRSEYLILVGKPEIKIARGWGR